MIGFRHFYDIVDCICGAVPYYPDKIFRVVAGQPTGVFRQAQEFLFVVFPDVLDFIFDIFVEFF